MYDIDFVLLVALKIVMFVSFSALLSMFVLLLCKMFVLISNLAKRSRLVWPPRIPLPLRAGLWISFPIGTAALVAGYLTGLSREAAVGDVLPAVIGLLSGGVIFVSRRRSIQGMIRDSIVLILFSIELFVGVTFGANDRLAARNRLFSDAALRNQARQELRIRTFRENLGLPTDLSTPPVPHRQ